MYSCQAEKEQRSDYELEMSALKRRDFKYLGKVVRKDGKCDIEIRMCTGIARYLFRKLNKSSKNL